MICSPSCQLNGEFWDTAGDTKYLVRLRDALFPEKKLFDSNQPPSSVSWGGLMQDSLESLALKLAMLVGSSLLEDEVTRLCGRRYERRLPRTHTRSIRGQR